MNAGSIRRRIVEPPPQTKHGRANNYGVVNTPGKRKPKVEKVTFVQAARRLPNRVKNDKKGNVPPPKQASRLGKGQTFLPDKVDQRSARARRYRENFRDIISDLGGPGYVTVLQKSVAKRAAAFIVMLEELELEWLLGTQAFDLEQYDQLARTMLMFSRVLGLRRLARTINDGKTIEQVPSLKEYVEKSAELTRP